MKKQILFLAALIITFSVCNAQQSDNTELNKSKFENQMSSIDSNKKIVRLFYEEGWNNRNFDIVYQTHSKKWTHLDSSNPNDLSGGPEGNIKRIKELSSAFSDLKFHIEEIVAERKLVVVRFLPIGTHKGQFGPIPASNRSVSMSGYITHRIENIEITEDWVVMDTYGLLMQLGVINAGK